MVKFEAPIFEAGDRISAFLYDQWGWHLRVIAMWTYTLFTGPTVDLLIAGDRIDRWGEWMNVAVPMILGFWCLALFKRATLSNANTYMVLLRTGSFMMFLRMLSVAFAISYTIGALLSPEPVNIARAIHEVHYCLVLYWTCTIVPDRPRKKRRLLPVLKLFPDPVPQGA